MRCRALASVQSVNTPTGLIYCLAVFFLQACSLYAQDTLSNTSYGKEFYVCFPLNDEAGSKNDSLTSCSLFLTPYKKAAANVLVSYVLNGSEQRIQLQVEPDSVGWVRIPVELEITNRLAKEKKSIHIESDVEIGVYVMSHKVYSSDAYLAFPVKSLDTTYIVSSWPNIIRGNVIGARANKYGGFVIIATEDSTVCKLVPSCPIDSPLATTGDTVSVQLNRGELRYITASVANKYDITGTIVTSTTPFVLLSVHERAAIPNVKGTYNLLVEQCPPVTLLGTDYVLNPYNSSTDSMQSLIRVCAYYDATRIKGGDIDTVLYAREFVEISCKHAMFIHSNKPILVAQYETSSAVDASSKEADGDPFMVIVPSVEQYCQSYTILSPPDPAFTSHWLNIAVSKAGKGRLTVDGVVVPDSSYKSVETTDYYAIRIPVAAGVHRLSCDTTFGVVAYGFGVWDGYGYCAGMKTERILERIMDKVPPSVQADASCGVAHVIVSDTGSFISGADSVFVKSNKNVDLSVIAGTGDSSRLYLNAKLIDPHQDGYMEYFATDRAGNMFHDTLQLYGFTVTSAPSTYTVVAMSTTVDSICLTNTGEATQAFTLKLQQNTQFAIPPRLLFAPFSLAAHDSLWVPLYISVNTESNLVDTLGFVDACGRSRDVVLRADARQAVYSSSSSCGIPLTATSDSDTGVYLLGTRFSSRQIECTLSVYTVLGQLIDAMRIKPGCSYDMASFGSGLYMYSIQTSSGQVCGKLVMP